MRINIKSLPLFVLPAALAIFLLALYLHAAEDRAEALDNYYDNAKTYSPTAQTQQGQWLAGQDMTTETHPPVTYFPVNAGVQDDSAQAPMPSGYNYEDSCKDCQKTWTG
jgi:hypothetical protein